MTMLRARDLDGRNVGSIIGLTEDDGTRVYGTLDAIERDPEYGGRTFLYLGHLEDPVDSPDGSQVDVYLSPEAKFLSHMNSDLQSLLDAVLRATQPGLAVAR